MTTKLRKITALVLCAMLMFSMMPTYAFALDETTIVEPEEVVEETVVTDAEVAEEIASAPEVAEETTTETEEEAAPEVTTDLPAEASESVTEEATEEANENAAEDVAADVAADVAVDVAEEVTETETPSEETAQEETDTEAELPKEDTEENAPTEETEEANEEATAEENSEEAETETPLEEENSEEAVEEESVEESAEEETEEETESNEIDPNKLFKYRLLVGFGGSINTREEDAVLGTFDNVVLLGFDSAAELNAAKEYYAGIALFASIDGAVNASTNESAPTNVDTASASAQADSASANDNPIAAASEENTTVIGGKNTIALVDTGAGGFNVITTLSVLGDNGADSNGHGTALASIIAIENPNAKIISIKALDGNGKGSVASVYAGVKLAIESGADIIVLPFSARGYSAAIESIINEAIAKGIYVVVAAGNDAADASGYCPANVWSAITVGALNAEGEIAGFSNSGSYVDAWAIADSTSEASAKVAAGLSLGKDLAEYQMGTETVEEEEPTEEEAEEFETAYNTTSDSVVDGGVYIIRLRKDPKRSIVQYTGTLENGNKFVLSNGEKREDSGGQFKVQKINYNFYIKLRDNTNYIMSPEGGATYVSSNGTKVHMWYKTSSNYKDFDQWWLKSVDNGKYYRITNGTNTGMHLQTEGSNTAGGTAIHLWNATSGTQGDWIFERVHYYVKFNGNGNTGGSMSNQKIWQEVGTALTANAFTRTGYTFNGWNTNSSGTGTNYSDKQKVTCLTTTNAATVNVYAKWKANTYSVKYDGNGSTSGTMSNSSHTYDSSKALTSNAYSKTGYTFNGWNTKADGTGTAYANGASVKNLTSTNGGTVTLYAQWKANTWYVEYNGNGSTGGSTAKSTHTYDTAKNLTNNGFTKTGYSFNGWNTKADGTGTAYSNGASVKNLTSTSGGTITLYAQRKANNYVITLDGQNATTTGTKNAYYTFDTAKYYSDSEHKVQIESIEIPARTGYEFGGYYASPNGAGTQYITAAGAFVNNPHKVASDKTLYAKWTAKTYTVSLDANGGKLAGSSISDSTEEEATATATFDETFTLHHPVREGYTFAGWTIGGMEAEVAHSIGTHTSTDASADDVAETTFKNLRAEAGTVNFVAKWTANTYTVRYDANGGTLAEGTENPYAATFDESFSVKAPTRAGYVFMGWKITGMDGAHHVIAGTEVTDHTYTHSVDEADEKVTLLNLRGQKGEVEVTAVWADDKYEVGYDLNGGVHEDVAQDEVKSYDYNKTFHLANPTKAGYKFTGWTIDGMDAGTTHIAGGEETTAEELTAVMGTSFGKLNANGGSVTMTATWKAADITVVLVAPDATNDYTKEINYTYKDNSGYYQDAEHKAALSSPVTVPTRENYTFTGFYENTDAEGTAVIPADGTIPEAFYEKYTQATNLYAGWEASVYEITLSQNGATEEGTKKIYEKYAEGVFTDKDATVELDAIDIPSRELLVTFDANADGDVQDPDNMSANAKFAGYFDGETMLIATSGKLTPAFAATYFTAAKTLAVKWDDAIIKLPALPERENYTFDGWFTEAFGGTKVGNAGDEYAFSDNEMLYAHWNLDPDLYYDGNGGVGGEMAATIAKGKTITPSECGYTKAGYSFVEWDTKADGTGTAYKAGVKTVWNEDLGSADHYTLYAQWEKNEFDHIKAIADMKYTGNAIMPKLTVYDKNGDVVSADDYTLTWNNNIKVGTATVTVVAKAGGNFAESESVSAEFNIVKANAEYFEVKAENYAGIYDGTNHALKATAKTEDEGHAYKIGYGKTEAEAKVAAEEKTSSATTNSGYDVKTVADSGIYFYYIIPDNYEAFGGTLNASITTKALTVSGIKGVTRTYNGSTAVELDAAEAALVGVCTGDEVTVNTATATAVSANKNVGTHSVQVSGLAPEGKDVSNYTLVAPTDVKATITKKEIHVAYEKDSYTYDGTAKTYNRNLVQLNASDIVSGDEVNAGSLTGNVATNVGTYQVKLEALTGSDAMNYAIAEGEPGELEITKAENEVAVDITGWTYGKSANAPTSKAVFGEENVVYTYSENGETWAETVPVNAGNYMVKATVPETTNYAEASATKAFVIEKAAIKVTADDGMVVRNGDALPVITYTVTGDFVEADRAALEAKIEASTNADITKAGKYQTSVDWKNASDVLDNYNVTFVEGTFTVTRNDTVVNAEGYTGIYGGQNDDHGITVEVVGDSGAAVYYTAAQEGFDSEITALVADVHDAYDKTDEEFETAYTALAAALATKNYDLTSPVMHDAQVTDIHYIVITDQSKPDVIVGTETVEIKPAALTVIAKDRAIVYGDPAETSNTEIGEKVEFEGLVEGETEEVLDMSEMTFDYQNYTEEPEVGAYAITAFGLKEAEGKHNYEATYKTGTLTVNPKAVELEWTTPNEFNYNGTERSVTAEVTNAILGDVISVAAYTNNAKTEVGDYTATATELTGAKAKNYTLAGSESASYAWSVVPFNNQVSVSVDDWTYGDMASEAVVTAELDADKAVVEFFTDEACENKTTAADGAASVGGRPSYAGTYYVKATLERTDLYEGSFSIDEFEITKRTITLQADNKASVHDEALKPLTYQMGGMAYGSDDLGIILSTEATSSSAAGEYEIAVTTSDDAHITRNYDITPVNGTYTITKAKMGVSAEGYIGNYDGKAHGIKVTLDPNEAGKATIYYATEELTVENYKTVGTKSATDESVTVKDAGTKTIYYYVESKYYEGEPAIAGSVDVTINKIELTVTANENTITYGDEADNAGVTYAGFIEGEDENNLDGALSYRYEKSGVAYEQGSYVGEYEIIPAGLDSANYEISYVSGVMTVEPKAVTFTWDKNSYAYDAEEHRPTATIDNALAGDNVNVNSYNGSEETNVGAYVTEVASIGGSDAANYVMLQTEKSASHNWKITKSENAWNIEPAISDWTYGKTASIPTSVAKLGKDTVVYEYKKAGLLHILDSYTSEVPTEAGNYIMRATVPGTENYREIKATVDFQIKPVEIVISADDKISMYRTALLPLSYTVSGDYVEGDELGILLSTDATLLSSVGEYDINANWDENPNYSATISKGTYSITKGYLNISASDVSAVYDGQPHGINVEIIEPHLHDAIIWYSDVELTEENIETAEKTDDPLAENVSLTDVGTKTVYYYIESENFDKNPDKGDAVSGSKTVTITKADLTVNTGDQHIVYGEEPEAGKPVDVKEGISYIIPTGCVDDLDITNLDYDYTYTKFQNVGEYDVTAKGIESNNYNIIYAPGKLVVGKHVLTFTWISEIGSLTDFGYQYDGEEHKVIAVPVTLNGDELGELTYEQGEATDAGNYTARVTALPESGKAVNYTFDEKADSTTQNWGIEQAENSWTEEPEIVGWTYGEEVNAPSAEAKFGEVTFTYRPSNSDDEADWTAEVPTKAGEYTVRAHVEETDNYKGLSGYATLEIEKAQIEIAADDKTSKYMEGLLPFTYTITYETIANYVEGDELDIEYTCVDEEGNAITDIQEVGAYDIDLVATNEDALNNYDITYDEGVYTITKGDVDYEASGWEGMYDGKSHGINVEVTTKEDAEEAKVFYSMTSFVELLGEAFLEDLENDITGEKLELLLGRFDDTEIEEEDPETGEVTISKGDLSEVVFEESPELKDVNESAPIYYLIVSANYKPIAESEEVVINKKSLTITADDKEIVYGDDITEGTCTYDGFVEGEDESVLDGTLEYTFGYKQYEDIGTYEITASGLTSENYEITYVDGAILVSPKVVSFIWPDEENSKFDFDGEEKSITATLDGTVNGDEESITIIYSENVETEFGKYTAKVTSLEGEKAMNYLVKEDEPTATRDWKIREGSDETYEEGSGEIIIETDIYSKGMQFEATGMSEETALSLLTEEELERVREDGEIGHVYLEITKVEALTDEEEKITSELEKEMDYTSFIYLDIKVYKKIGDDSAVLVHDIGEEITFVVVVPEELRTAPEGYTRAFIVIRAHEGETTVLAGPTEQTRFEFSSSLFSGFTVAFKDTKLPEPPVDPADPTVDPADPTVGPADPTVGPVDPTVDPANPTVDPTNPTVDPTVDPTNPETDPENDKLTPASDATNPENNPSKDAASTDAAYAAANTGDESNIILWFIIIMASLILMLAASYRRKMDR